MTAPSDYPCPVHRGFIAVGYDGSQYVTKEHCMEKEPQTARERVDLLLRATFLPGWRPTASQRLVWAIRGATVLGVLALIASAVDKPLWDWLDLLIVPVVLAIGGYLFNSSQNRAAQRAAELRAQDDALQAYLDDMTDMLTPKKDQSSLNDDPPPNSLRHLARARTLTVLTRLDGVRKAHIVQFLYESGLITRGHVVVDLSEADLREANLTRTNLIGSDLRRAVLRKACLRESNLGEADLREVDLREANLSGTNLGPNQAYRRGANLSTADLREADLSGANLFEADLSLAKLGRANLRGAHLLGANLLSTDLTNAEGVTEEQLANCKSLEEATMPNGQAYVDWLKTSEGKRYEELQSQAEALHKDFRKHWEKEASKEDGVNSTLT